MEIFQESLEYALHVAIKTQEELEASWGYVVDSALLATWRLALKAVENNRNLVLK